jgi:hypothetical protein
MTSLTGPSVVSGAASGASAERPAVSRWLSRVDRHASRPLAAVLVAGAAGVWIVVSITPDSGGGPG